MTHNSSWTATDSLDSFDCTLANLREVVFAALDAAGARTVAEIGAEHGLFTAELLAWAAPDGMRVTAVDPSPQPRLLELAAAQTDLELIVATSHAALPEIDLPDAVIIDGDHNYFTVSEELRLIGERAPGAELPLLLVHDVGWPLGRRDTYADPERIPPEHRQPIAERGLLAPGNPGLAERGLYYEGVAAAEGGPRNGVLTAVEDFLAERPGLRLAVVAPFFGLAVVWHPDAAWASELEAAIAPWDRNPVLERVEAKRVDHLVAEFEGLQEIDAMRSEDYELQFLLANMLHSRAFSLAERVSRMRQGGRPMFSREQVERALERARADNDLIGSAAEPAEGGDEVEPRAPHAGPHLEPPSVTDLA